MSSGEVGGNPSVNPYIYDVRIRRAFEEGSLSQFETYVNEPLFLDMLPKGPNIDSILDIGCGPDGLFALCQAYPDPSVRICGLDLPEMLPEPGGWRAKFFGWPGPERLGEDGRRALVKQLGRFKLITIKMMAHYVDLASLAQVAADLLAKNGSIALSIPHPEDTARYLGLDPKKNSYFKQIEYIREIGKTGIEATMIYRPTNWWAGRHSEFAARLPPNYRQVVEELCDEQGDRKRLNILFRPPTRRERVVDALQWIAAKAAGEERWGSKKIQSINPV